MTKNIKIDSTDEELNEKHKKNDESDERTKKKALSSNKNIDKQDLNIKNIAENDINIEHKTKDDENNAENDKDLKQAKKISKSEIKYILLVVAVIVIIFGASLGGFKFTKSKAPGEIPVDRLHEMNKNGDLEPERGYMYKGYSFVFDDGLWWTEFFAMGKMFKTPLHFGPKDLEEINIEGFLDPAFNEVEDIFVAIDPNIRNKFYSLALSELSFNLAKIMNRAPIGSCITENSVCENRKIINCENTEGKPVIQLEINEIAGIELKGTCVKVKGTEYELTKAVDRLLYRWYGIMD